MPPQNGCHGEQHQSQKRWEISQNGCKSSIVPQEAAPLELASPQRHRLGSSDAIPGLRSCKKAGIASLFCGKDAVWSQFPISRARGRIVQSQRRVTEPRDIRESISMV
ncbi:UNVERIFIED_CONTAM: hypothetical protein K2H54_036366 [Gekko kuhli]